MPAQSRVSGEERTIKRELSWKEIQAFQLAVHNVLFDAEDNLHFVNHGRLGSLLQYNSTETPICSAFLRRSASV